jgi:hypothetical protein
MSNYKSHTNLGQNSLTSRAPVNSDQTSYKISLSKAANKISNFTQRMPTLALKNYQCLLLLRAIVAKNNTRLLPKGHL